MGSDSFSAPALPDTFKGLALFTPGGDLVYCIDPDKKTRWHLQLCALLQEILGLAEPPHFLVPCYTATVDRWRNSKNQQLQLQAEAHPLVLRHQALLNAVFATENLVWQPAPRMEGVCDRLTLDRYQNQFPDLWDNHELVVRLTSSGEARWDDKINRDKNASEPAPGYVFRLYVAGHTSATEAILKNLHTLLERSLKHPYTLRVIDIHKNPEQAEQDKVTATPTLVRIYPRPVRRLVGDIREASHLIPMLTSPDL